MDYVVLASDRKGYALSAVTAESLEEAREEARRVFRDAVQRGEPEWVRPLCTVVEGEYTGDLLVKGLTLMHDLGVDVCTKLLEGCDGFSEDLLERPNGEENLSKAMQILQRGVQNWN